jgi:hypothetical protein
MQRYGRDDDRRDDEYRGRNRELDESRARGIRDESERSAYSQSEYGDRYRFQNRDDERGRDRDEIRDFRRDVDERGRELNPRAAFYGGGFFGPGSRQWPVRQPYDVSRESGYYRDADSDWIQEHVREGRSFGGVSPQTGLGRRRDGGFFGRGPKGYTRSDERIQEDVCDRLTDDDELDASEITVTTRSGEVTLEGAVNDRRSKHRAEDIADAVPGVREVHNRLRARKGLIQEVGDRLTGRDEAQQHGHAGSGPRTNPQGTNQNQRNASS